MTNNNQCEDDNLIQKIPKVNERQKLFLSHLINEVRDFSKSQNINFRFDSPLNEDYFGGYEPDNTKKCGFSLFGFNRVSKKTCMIIPNYFGIPKEYYFESKTWSDKGKVAIPLSDDLIRENGGYIIKVTKNIIQIHYRIGEVKR